jgi:hypothetical protein
MTKINKIEFLKQQKRDIFKDLGEVIEINKYKKIRNKLKTLNELITDERNK